MSLLVPGPDHVPKPKPPLGPLKVLPPRFNCTCGNSYLGKRMLMRYWPDHLWAGKIQAHAQCDKCDAWLWTWAHELPPDWWPDWQRFNWEEYGMSRLYTTIALYGGWFSPDLDKIVYMKDNWWLRVLRWLARWRSVK